MSEPSRSPEPHRSCATQSYRSRQPRSEDSSHARHRLPDHCGKCGSGDHRRSRCPYRGVSGRIQAEEEFYQRDRRIWARIQRRENAEREERRRRDAEDEAAGCRETCLAVMEAIKSSYDRSTHSINGGRYAASRFIDLSESISGP